MRKRFNHIKSYNDFVIIYGYDLSRRQHANHAIKIILSKDEVSVVHERKIYKAKGTLVKSDTAHNVKPDESLSISIFVDPEAEIGKLIGRLFKKSRILKLEDEASDNLFTFFNHVIENHSTESEIKTYLLKALFGSDSTDLYQTIDKRIEQVLIQIKSSPSANIKFSELLELCALSESRLIHLFKKEIGIPIRKYILWCKTKKAIMSMASGATIKQSAHFAGFTDAAHFNRAFVSMFGTAPSVLLK